MVTFISDDPLSSVTPSVSSGDVLQDEGHQWMATDVRIRRSIRRYLSFGDHHSFVVVVVVGQSTVA